MAKPTLKDWEDRIFACLRNLHPRAKIHVGQHPARREKVGVVVTYYGSLDIADLDEEVSAEEMVDLICELIPITWNRPEETEEKA